MRFSAGGPGYPTPISANDRQGEGRTRADLEEAAEPRHAPEDREPHHALNNPVRDPDPTEWPDPYDKREDPRDPAENESEPFGEAPHPPTGATSTSEPHPAEAPDARAREESLERDKLDD